MPWPKMNRQGSWPKQTRPPELTDRDPNEGSIDPMVPEYWGLGEAVQDRILAAGYEQESVDGIAVDIHDALQASTLIETELCPAIVDASSKSDLCEAVLRLQIEYRHLEWHARSGQAYLAAVLQMLQAE
jgi:hypothetical protein